MSREPLRFLQRQPAEKRQRYRAVPETVGRQLAGVVSGVPQPLFGDFAYGAGWQAAAPAVPANTCKQRGGGSGTVPFPQIPVDGLFDRFREFHIAGSLILIFAAQAQDGVAPRRGGDVFNVDPADLDVPQPARNHQRQDGVVPPASLCT